MQSLLSPPILFFAIGVVAAMLRSNLSIPEVVGKAIALYLMAAIGLKGGVQVSQTGITSELLLAAMAGIGLSLIMPFPVYWALRRLGRLDRPNAGAIAAHYGSVSVVTFVTGIAILETSGLPAAGYMVAVLALMEAPAIVTGLWLARRHATEGSTGRKGQFSHVMTDGSVLVLLGSFVVGLTTGVDGFEHVKPVFEGAFKGMLCLFLLEMGLVAARNLLQNRSMTPTLAALAITFALVNGSLGVVVGKVLGLDPGTSAALGILAGSASYIAAPAAIRLALPQVDIGLPLTMSLAVTFPFNILLGIPAFATLAKYVA
jgi:hypothetical protein